MGTRPPPKSPLPAGEGWVREKRCAPPNPGPNHQHPLPPQPLPGFWIPAYAGMTMEAGMVVPPGLDSIWRFSLTQPSPDGRGPGSGGVMGLSGGNAALAALYRRGARPCAPTRHQEPSQFSRNLISSQAKAPLSQKGGWGDCPVVRNTGQASSSTPRPPTGFNAEHRAGGGSVKYRHR